MTLSGIVGIQYFVWKDIYYFKRAEIIFLISSIENVKSVATMIFNFHHQQYVVILST